MKRSTNNPFRLSGGIFSFWLLFLAINTCSAQAKMVWDKTRHNFGSVQRGTVLLTTYTVTNTGNQPLLLQAAEVACSCTTVEWLKQPILPGQSGTLTVTFNTASVYGRQERYVELRSNAPGDPLRLYYKANVSRH
jgi:hypothetical protein